MEARRNNKRPLMTECWQLDSMPLGCVLTDLAGVISEPTPSAARLLSCSINELSGRALSRFVASSERVAFQNAIEKIARSCESSTLRVSLRRRDGAIVVATCNVSVVTDETQRPALLLWTVEELVHRSISHPDNARL
jgi:PAS domain S-box-containing protein